VVHFVLDDLGAEALEGFDPGQEILCLPADFDFAVPGAFPGPAQQRQAALLSFVGFGFTDDLRVQHQGIAGPILEGDDIFRHADHIGGHAHAGLLVVQQGIHQVPGGIQVSGGGGRGLPGKEKGVVNQFFYHRNTSFRSGRNSTKNGGP